MSALERLTAFRIFVGGLSERMAAVLRISTEPACRHVPGRSIRRSNAGATPDRSFTSAFAEAKSYAASTPVCTRSAAVRKRVAMPRSG